MDQSDRYASERFRAAWWCPSPHLQTVWGRFGRSHPRAPTFRVRWTTPDEDFLDLDFLDGPSGSPTLLVLHGLEGCSESKYVHGLLRLARKRGWRGAALNFRSCGRELNRAPRLYHSGETGDLDWVIDRLLRREPGAPLLAVGMSLGGNVLLKWLGETGDRVPDDFRAAAAISTPFDLKAGAEKLTRGLGPLYTRFFLRTLKAKALAKARQYPDLLDPAAIRSARDWREYDDAVTAPLHGFRDADEYWALSSSRGYLSHIRRPTLLINSRDDPFLPSSCLPSDAARDSQWLHPDFSDQGGHAGFVAGRLPVRARYWAEERSIAFLASHVGRDNWTGREERPGSRSESH